jgi:low affinity Fe/Cu permease
MPLTRADRTVHSSLTISVTNAFQSDVDGRDRVDSSKKGNRMSALFDRAAQWTAKQSGHAHTFALAIIVVIVWAVSGPLFGFSDTWQLVINTGTTIVTFLMVFLIQRAQNKDAQAVALKLNELIAALEGASNRLINAESLPEDDLRTLHLHFKKLVKLAERDASLTKSHSVEEAEARHQSKSGPRLSK